VTKIVCHHSLCGYWVADRCTAPGVEIDFDGVCLTQDEEFDELEELRLMESDLEADDEEGEEEDEGSFDEWEDEEPDEELDEEPDDEPDDDWTR